MSQRMRPIAYIESLPRSIQNFSGLKLARSIAICTYKKSNFPVEEIRRFIEPGPVVLVSSAWRDESDIMTMGWHMVMEFSPSLIGCYIWDQNYSRKLIHKSRECVINVPEVHLAKTIVVIGNSTGAEINKFEEFKLTPVKADRVKAPLIKECYANLECRLVDESLARKYSLHIFEVIKAHAAEKPKFPKTIHYRGDGQFMVAGASLNLRRRFKPEML